VIPFEALPGIPPLFLAFLRGRAGEFFPDPPVRSGVEVRGRELLRTAPEVFVATGQQAGLFTGPLLALTKALGARRLAEELSQSGLPTKAIFWISTEDHDLPEVARATFLVGGVPQSFRLDDPQERSFRPAGGVPIPESVSQIFEALRDEPGLDPEALSRFQSLWSPGKTFGAVFRETMAKLLAPGSIELIDPLEEKWHARKFEFFGRAVERAAEIEAALVDADERLKRAGFEPQVVRGEKDFPFFLIESGLRRRVTREAEHFEVNGFDGRLSARDLLEFAAEKNALPSAAALVRPVLASFLMPVAASLLGPSEIAYHAQTAPLFDVLEVRRPVFLPRPHLYPRGARERRAFEALGLEDAELFRAREAARGEAPALSGELREIEKEIARRAGQLRPQVERIDPTLLPALAGTAERATSALSKFREKVEKAFERRDEEKNRRLEIVENVLAPLGSPPDRVYSPLNYLARFGDAFVPKLASEAEWSLEGARFVDFE
jgi:bacillithiol biosynthesis cysteine-adding enzyme BshC